MNSACRLVDIQEWLSSDAVSYNGNESITNRSLIAGYAETSGPGHYDSGIPSVVDTMNQLELYGSPLMLQYLYKTGAETVELGKFVLDQFSTSRTSSSS